MEKYQYPGELKYSETHTWVIAEENSQIVIIGITDYMQITLGEIISVDLPEPNGMVDVGDEICSIEGTNTVLDIYAPLSGMLVEINDNLADAPGFINSDPYGDGWLYKLQIKDREEYNKLLNVDEYIDLVNENDE